MRAVPTLAPRDINVETRKDGGFVLRSAHTLRTPAQTLGHWIERWARERPEATLLAQRSPEHPSEWQRLTWVEAWDGARVIAASLLERGLSVERPVMVLSGNSIDHALLMLGCYLSGVPIVPVSVAYALRSSDHAQLRRITERVTPGLVFAEAAEPYAKALKVAASLGAEVITSLSELRSSSPLEGVKDDVGPETVAKILMTSGSTGLSKGVINTHRMLTSNQEALAQVWPFVDETPPVLVDWLPWSHTFGGNHNLNLVLRCGGTLYIDGGRPAPGLFDETLRNLAEISPTLQFNVPAGYAMLVQALEQNPALCATFFSRLQGLFYAAAALPQETWDRLDRVAERTLGYRLWLTTAWGSTETSPLVTSAHFPSEDASNIGLPVPGCALKFVPAGDKLELRVKGPNVTPGYFRQPELTAAAFDDEGYYRIGDAGMLIDPQDPSRGVRFDGRVAEDFKLASGTWVNVGRLRTRALSAAGGLLSHAVVAGHDTHAVVLLGWLDPGSATALTGKALPMSEWVAHPAIHAALKERLTPEPGAGASRRIARIWLLETQPELDAGEITDKGYVNANAVLQHRADIVTRCIEGKDAPALVKLTDALRIRPMTPDEIAVYRGRVLADFAQEKMDQEGMSAQAARQAAEDSWKRADPENNPDQHLGLLETGGESVGNLWYGIRRDGAAEPYAWVYDIRIDEAHRGKGLGRKAMQLFEAEAARQGLGAVGLHVFGHNTAARRLYESLGYVPTSIVMRKPL